MLPAVEFGHDGKKYYFISRVSTVSKWKEKTLRELAKKAFPNHCEYALTAFERALGPQTKWSNV